MTTHIHLSGTTSLLGFVGLGVAIYSLTLARRTEAAEPPPRGAPPPQPVPPPYVPSARQLPPPAASPLASPAPPPAPPEAATIPSHAVQVVDSVPHAAVPANVPEAKQRSAPEAAKDLYNYVVPLIRAGKLGAELGTAEQPNNFIAAAQRDMRIIRSDGVYGPKTAARGKELLGREFPPRNQAKKRVTATPATPATTPPRPNPPPARLGKTLDAPPAQPPAAKLAPPAEPPSLAQLVNEHAPQEAAAALYELVSHPPVNWGTKQKPNPLIAAAQRDMGGGLEADGVYGPKTRGRGTALLKKPFPPRK